MLKVVDSGNLHSVVHLKGFCNCTIVMPKEILFGLRGSLAKGGSKANWDSLASAGLATRLIPGQSPVELRL